MAEPPHILVVDDDGRLRELLKRYLADNGFRVSTAADAGSARAQMAAITFDLLVLDIMMPGESGLELTQWVRRTSELPVLLLTAMGEPDDRIDGLERGADDYLVKPFEPRELLLRIRTILRRVAQGAPEPAGEVRFGSYVFDLERETLRRDGEPVRLTTSEAALLKALAERAGTALSREDIVVRGAAGGNARTIDVQITRLRRKIEDDPKFPRHLVTVRGKGYVLHVD